MQLDSALRDALKKREFYLAYQPLIELKTNQVVGVETLLRWKSDSLGPVPPVEFIPILEDNGLIVEVGAWVLEQACAQTVAWHKGGFPDLSVAVNLSGRQLHQPHLPEIIQNILKKTGLPAKYLELELTESLLIDHVERAVELMQELKSFGVRLAIDDFGTGYSSLSYLKQFPIDKLKIDQSFIKDIASDENDAAIVKAIINLGKSLDLQVLAEGIENEFQKKFLILHGCEYGQGYYYKPPATHDIIKEFLEKGE